MKGKKEKKPKIKVLKWPALPVPTPEEVYGLSKEEMESISKKLRKKDKGNE